MSVRVKLVLSYFALILLSISILVIGFLINTGRLIDGAGPDGVMNLLATTTDVKADVAYIYEYEPEVLSDPVVLEAIESDLADKDLGMYLAIDGEFVYESQYDGDFNLPEVIDGLRFGLASDNGDIEITDYRGDGSFNMITKWRLDSQDEDFVYFVYQTSSYSAFHWDVYGNIYRVAAAVVITLMALLSFLMTQNVIKPLQKLEEATHEIRQGNLDYSIQTEKKDEFGQLMNAFDTMRVELKHSIEQQIQYEENRKELIASISHDLKTPITSIKGYVEGIRDGIANDEEKMDQYLEVIHQKSIDLDRMIDDLFLYSKLDLNNMPFNFTGVNAKRFFDDCGDELALDVEKSGFVFDYTNTLPEDIEISVDLQQFRRVITNVIGNAIKYSEETKAIEFMVEWLDDKVRVAIKDHGKGIDPASLEKIFEKFYRADSSRNQEVMGSGLGLAIAKQIMTAHKGLIRAESIVGVGTTIYLEIGKAEGQDE